MTRIHSWMVDSNSVNELEKLKANTVQLQIISHILSTRQVQAIAPNRSAKQYKKTPWLEVCFTAVKLTYKRTSPGKETDKIV